MKIRKITTLLAATFLATGLATAASAKTLVYCSEGSPEGFDPALYTAGTTFDASGRTDLQPPGRVRARHDQRRAGPGRELGRVR